MYFFVSAACFAVLKRWPSERPIRDVISFLQRFKKNPAMANATNDLAAVKMRPYLGRFAFSPFFWYNLESKGLIRPKGKL